MSTYTDLATVKALLGIPTGTTTYDAEITDDIAAAAGAIEERTSRIFTQDTNDVARKFWPENSGYAILDDLAAFTSLVDQSGTTWTRETDFYLEPNNAQQQGRPWTAIRTIARPFIFTKAQTPAGWPGFDGRITVTGKWGWPAVPAQIAKANALLAARFFRRRDAPLAVLGLGTETEALRLGAFDPDVAALVDPFALITVV